MVKTASSAGGMVQVEILGINEVLQRFRKINSEITKKSEIMMAQIGVKVANEVKESIRGERAEIKSVRTGLFGTSVSVQPISSSNEIGVIITPDEMIYPGTSTTTRQVATMLEYGTTRQAPRSHFRNTKARMEPEILKEFQNNISITVNSI